MRRTLSSVLIFSVLMFFSPASVFADTTIQPSTGTSGFISFAYNTSQTNDAQSFKATQGGTISSIIITTNKVGSPTGTLTVAIEADSAGAPSNTAIQSGTVSIASLSTFSGGVCSGTKTITLASPVTVTNGTTYWVTFRPNNTLDATNYLVGCGSSPSSYADGTEAYSTSGNSWTTENVDINLTLTIVNAAVSVSPTFQAPFWW